MSEVLGNTLAGIGFLVVCMIPIGFLAFLIVKAEEIRLRIRDRQ